MNTLLSFLRQPWVRGIRFGIWVSLLIDFFWRFK